MKLNKSLDDFHFESKLNNEEVIVIYPGNSGVTWFQSTQGIKPEEKETYLYILFRNSKNVYKITNGDFEQLKEEEFESEQDLVDKLLVAKI